MKNETKHTQENAEYNLNGIIRFQRSVRKSSKDCNCCKGNHIFGRYIEFEGQPTRNFPGLSIKRIDDWFHEMLNDDDGFENADIEIIVKIAKAEGRG